MWVVVDVEAAKIWRLGVSPSFPLCVLAVCMFHLVLPLSNLSVW